MIDKSTIGKIIQNCRKQKKYSQEELSEIIGISTNHLSKVERGLCLLNAETFLKIVEILGCSLEDFGIKTSTKIDTTKQDLINRILILSPKEVDTYSKLLDTMNFVIKNIK